MTKRNESWSNNTEFGTQALLQIHVWIYITRGDTSQHGKVSTDWRG